MRHRIIDPLIFVAVIACTAALATPARALTLGDDALEPPGLQDRETHMTMLTTVESECVELPVVRAVTWAGARALVPDRYEPTMVVSGGMSIGRFQMWDYVCERLSVDGQSHSPRTQISIGAIALTARDGVPVSGAYYLVSLATDNAVLAARYQQVGLPATFTPGLVATVSDQEASPFEVSFDVPSAPYVISAVSATAPSPIPRADAAGPSLFFEGQSGEVALSYTNTADAQIAAQVTGDYREYGTLASIIALPRLLQPAGAPFVLVRGDWAATATRLD